MSFKVFINGISEDKDKLGIFFQQKKTNSSKITIY